MVQNPDLLDASKWNDEDIVISGISARLPNCDSVEEFQRKLLAKIDLITDEPRRFQNGLYGAIKRYGLLKDLSKFDAKFFNIHPKQAQRMDPQIRGLLEVAFEATVDAGLHPEDLKGSKTGVVVGVASSETQDKWSQMPDKINGFEYTGCTRTMFANRVSYMLDLKGPSYSIDTASSTTLVAFQQAYDMIKDGVCDACFVCGTDLVLNPCVCLMFQCLNMLSPEGKCKAFDIGGDGYVRSEGVVAVLLQKAKNAKRVYAKVLAAGSNCDGYKDEGITFPSGAQQVKLFRRVAQLAGVDPSQIDFMEAHGSATRVGDPQEMNAVTEVFVKGRKEPLRTGSIKSNMGHAEPASALSAVIKVCVAMESGILPPNLHYNVPNPDIPALLDGRLKVITEPTPWDGGLVAVNSFGVGGANGHALLLSNKKVKNNLTDNIPRLVCVSGVNESAVENMLNKLNSLPRDPELYALLNNVYRKNIRGHDFRGYMVLSGNGVTDIKEIPRNAAQSLCLILPGVEGDWKATSADMFNLIEFRNSIKKCENALKGVANNINLKKVLMTLNTEKSVLNVILGITALQIGIIDVLKSLNVIPDYVIGFNIGEIVSGYVDDRYSLEQAILSAFHIGALIQRYCYSSSVIRADVESNKYIPSSDISVLAKISSQCTFFSGPKQSIDNFSRSLNSKGITTKEIGSNALDIIGILKSSKNISKLAHDLELVLSSAMQPTKRWLTHALHEPNLDNCASRLINSLTNFSPIQKAINKIGNSFTLEIGFGSNVEILQKSTHPGISVFHGQADVYSFISTVGRLYNLGFQPQVQNLYPAVQFPVSHGTPLIQSMIEWDHSVNWNVVSFAPKEGRTAGEIEVVVDFNKEDFSFLPGNYLNCSQVFPKSFYIILLWRAIGRLQVKPVSEIPLVIENLSFTAETTVPDDGNVTFTVNVMNTSNKFEIWESGRVVATGHVNILADVSKEVLPQKIFDYNSAGGSTGDEIYKSDIYNDLNVKHYCYNETFQQLESVNYQNNTAKIASNNWCALLESFLQISLLKTEFKENTHSVISFIRKIVINPATFKNKEVTSIKYNKEYDALKSDCLEIRGVKIKTHASVATVKPKLEAYKFVPFIARNVQNACEISLQMAVENWSGQSEVKIAELSTYNTYNSLLSPKILNGNPLITTDITVYSSEPLYSLDEFKNTNIKTICKDLTAEPVDNNCHIVIASNVLSNTNLLDNVIKTVRTDGCIVLEENIEENVNIIENTELQVVSYLTHRDKCYVVLKKVSLAAKNAPYVITGSNDSFEWIKNIQKISTQPADNILIVAKGLETHGILNFVRSVRAEVKNKNISIIITEDETAPMFSVTCELYHDQLKSNYPVNVFKNGAWGTYLPVSLSWGAKTPTSDAYVGFNFDEDPVQIAYVKDDNNISKKNSKSVICDVHSASLNLKDQSLVKGKFSEVAAESKLGLEFSGYNGREKVFGLVPEGALASSVAANNDFIWSIPKNWTMEEAATVPFSYALAYYALCLRGNLKEKSSALIVGANSIAIASIYIALQYHLNVFILLSEKSEKLLLKKLFPQIKDTQMIVSRNNNFYIQILQRTANKGVNIVFDTLSRRTYNVRAYVSSLSENGKLVYLDNEDVSEEILGSSGNMRCITYHRVTASCIFENDGVMKRISDFIKNGTKFATIQPLPYTLFSDEELNSALSYVADGNELYKAVINLKNEDNSSDSTGRMFNAKPRVYFDSSKSFVILGATEGFGLYVTNWMISHGVRNLVLISSENESSSENLKKIYLHKWKSLNTSIITLKLDNFNLKTCEIILNKALQLGPIEGIFDFTASKILENKSMETLQENDFKNTKGHKFDFLQNMDMVSRKLCPHLKYFVSFSSVEFSYGVHGYSANNFNNGAIQNIVRNRKNSNLCATLIQWGNIGESGTQVLYENTKSLDLALQQVNSCLSVLHIFLENSEPVLSSYVVSERSGSGTYSKADVIVEGVAKFLGIKDPSTVLPTLTMLELGLDSLIGTDIQQFLEINYGVTLSTQEVRELTFEKLRNLGESL